VLEGVDVTSPDSLRAAAVKVGTPVDVLIANAGLLTDEPFESLGEPAAADRIRRQFEVNALGALLTVHAFSNRLERGARVAIMTSRMGSIADNTSGGRYGYRMSKAALNAAAQSLALDLKPRGVAVAILHPGYVRTEMTSRHGDVEPEQAAANLIERIDALDLKNTGTFWHANGTVLPW
jgi:NAD(P)-dependent dehydrogenase (short-subunit alcohol dehydrogenase family)